MDVIALLNSGPEAAVQQEEVESTRTPPRSRTPWDADGYSLPMTTIAAHSHSVDATILSPQATPLASTSIHSDDSPYNNQKRNETSFRHKSFSSRSSLSSTSSSLQSATHSRLSSLSTVNSCQTGQTMFAVNGLSFMSESITEGLDLTSLDVTNDYSTALSPTGSLGALALVAERHLSADRAESIDRTSAILNATPWNDIKTSTLLQEGLSQARPRSPSDAILIKRSITSVHNFNSRESDEREPLTLNYSSTPLEKHKQPTFIKSHKRCVSAPDISATMNEFPTRQPADMRPMAEPTPPSSQPPGSTSPTTSIYQAPDTPPSVNAESVADAVVCMYIENCDTGSQPRKAISHIFGRNKMCTRLIPSHVWVHYCRKHYQRSRYRNPKEYAKLQCDLVQQQIRRVHEWSVENMKIGATGVVQDWGLSVRKREKKRLDDLGGANRKRSAAILDRNDDDETESFDNLAGTTGSPIPATAVPDWLLSLCGKGYSTQEILDIFNRLHTEILNDRMACFPDIEILPNIAVEQDEPGSPKSGTKRRSRAASHRRSQSLGVAMKSESDSPDRRLSGSSAGVKEMPSDAWPGQKRRRPDEQDTDDLERFLPRVSRSRMGEPSQDAGRRIQHLVHRPVFANITENQADEDNHMEVQQGDYRTHSSASYAAPFPAASNQRSASRSKGAAQQEQKYHQHGSRRLHRRSQSDVTAFSQDDMPPQSAMSSSYFVDDQARACKQQVRDHPNSYAFLPPQDSAPGMRHGMRQPLPNPGHARHQSTPVTYQPSNEPSSQSIGAHSSIPHTRNSNHTLHYPRQIYETQLTKDVYSARR